MYEHAYYLEAMQLDKFRRVLPRALEVLAKYDFDSIAFRGLSGALSAIPLAHMLNKQMIAVRKKEENNHSGRAVEGFKSARRYIIVDDIISSGATRNAIIRAIKVWAPQAVCIGTLEWLRVDREDYRLDTLDLGYILNPLCTYDVWGEYVEERKARPASVCFFDEWAYYEPMGTIQKEITNEKSDKQEAAQSREEALRQVATFNTAFPALGLQRSSERSRAEARGLTKQEQAENFRKFTELLYPVPRGIQRRTTK